MKKLKLFFACLLMAVLSIGQVWGAESLYKTASFAKANCTKSSTYTGSVTCTIGTDSWTAAYAANNNGGWDYIKMGGKRPSTGGSTVHTGTIITSASYSDAITKVVVNGSLDRGSVSAKLIYASNSDFTSDMVESDALVAFTDGKMTFTIASPVADRYYKLEFVCTNATTTNGVISISSVEYYIESSAPAKTLVSIAVSGNPEKTSYYEGDNFDPAGLVVTGTYSDDSHEEITSGITWSYKPAQELALNQTSIGVIATVDNIASAEFTVSSLSVTEAPAAIEYALFSGDIEEGDYVIYYSGKAMKNTVASNRLSFEEVTPVNDKIKNPSEAIVWHIAPAATEGYWTIYNADIEKYLVCTGSNNQANLNASTDNALVSVVEVSEGNYNFLSKARQDAGSNNYYLRENGTYGYAFYGSGTGGVPTLYKKIDGTEKQAAGLAYDAADKKKLTKLGEAFTAPTLDNPNQLTVTYASDNTDVAEVASNGAVTIKAVGVAVITASFAGNDNYKAGSASYTIGVTAHAGTEADPYVAADAKIAIDVMGIVENAYATGVVSSIYSTSLPTEGYITFYFSADGGTTGQQIEAYKCYGQNSAPFEALTDVQTGATVVVTGNLKKYNSTYEFDANCHLVSYEAPATQKTHIANDQAHPYTVAQAITFANDGVHYELNDFVYVQGVVYDVKSFSSTNGTLDIYIKDADAENQFELFKCAGINDGNATSPFEALTDVQSTNIVIAYGQLMVYNSMSELKQGNYLVDLQAPVTAVEMGVTAEVEVGSTVTLTAHVMPSNADQSLTWSVVSGSEFASVADGVVTGVAEGEAVIRVASTDDPTKYSDCTVTVNPAAAPLTDYYQKVTSTDNIVDGTYLIVYEAGNVAFNGGLTTLDAESNTIDVVITNDHKIGVTQATEAATFFIDVTAGSIQAASGKYIGANSYGNRLDQSEEATTYVNALSIDADGNAVISLSNSTWDGDLTLRYNSASNQARFRYYKNGQQPIALYKLANEVVKADPGISWDTESAELTLNGDITPMDYPKPELIILEYLGDNPLDFITLSSDNESLATINETSDGQINISWVPNATGIVHFTAAFPGNDTYKAVTAVCTVTIKPEPQPASTDNVVILASFDNKLYAMSNTIDNKSCVAIEVEADGENIIVPSEEAKAAIQWTKDFNGITATFQDANNKYLKGASSGGDLTLVDDEFNWTWDESTDYHCFVVGTRSFIFRGSTYNVFKNYAISNVTDPNNTQYAGVEIRVIDPANIIVTTKVDPELAFDPASVILTVGDNFVAPALSYADNFDGLAEVTLESSNPDLATVENNVVSLVADATGTATITASFPGNANYKSGNASYTITVNEAGDDLSGTWVLASSVAAGDEIIIMGANNADIYTMGKQNPNNRAAVASSLDEDVLTPGAGTKVFTLVDAGNGKFAIQASNGNYLTSATSGTSNNLLEAADYDLDNAKWTISIEEGVASIVAAAGSKTVMQYNSSNTLFSCYGSANQKPVKIFKKEAVEPVPAYVDVRTGLEPYHYYTICYPNAMSSIKGATLWSFIGKDAQYAYLVQETASTIEAGKPYIMYATASTVQAVLGDDTNAPGANGAIHGTFSNLVQEQLDGLATVAGHDLYLVIGDELRRATGAGTGSNTLPAQRAFVVVGEIPDAPANMPAHVRRMPMHKDAATGISNIGASETPVKVLIDGQLFILRGEKMYDAKGQLVK